MSSNPSAEQEEGQSDALGRQNDELVAAHRALREAHERLEERVQERTADLSAAYAALADREASLKAAASELQAEVAERRRAEAELAAQTNQLRDQADLLELTHDTILVRDLNAHILYWNRGAEAQYGYTRAEVLGQRSHALLKTKFPRPVREVYRELLDTGRWEGELVHTRRDGEEIIVYSRWALQRDERGKPVRVLETNNNITARKRAEQILWRQSQRLQMLHEIDLAVLAASSSQQIAAATLQHLRQVIACERAVVVVFDYDRQQAVRLAIDSDGEIAVAINEVLPLEVYPWWPEHQRGRAYAIDDLATAPATTPLLKALKDEGLHAFVSIPLLAQGHLIGLLNLAAARPKAFVLADLDIARQVGDSLAVALEQARLYEREHHAREVAEGLRQANVALTQSLNLDTVLETLLNSLQRIVQYRSAQVLMLEEDSCLALGARKGRPEEPVAPASASTRILGIEQYPAYNKPLTTGKSLLIPNTAEYQGWDRMPLLEDAPSWMGVPLIAGGKVLGLLSIYGAEPGSFTDEHAQLVEAVAGQAAVALQNARLFQQIDAARRQLQALSRRLVDIQEEERRYIARELHDEAGQELTSLLVGLGLLGRELADRPSLLARVQELKEMTDGIMANLHRLSVRLRPAVLDRLGLVPALRQHVETFLEENGLTGEFATVGLDNVKLSPEVEITVYRVVQEALTNIARHAQASHVDVLLEKRDSDGGEPRVLAIIEDDGVGFDPVEAAQRGRLGVFGMEERAQVLGGSFQVESMPGAGTTVFVEIPI